MSKLKTLKELNFECKDYQGMTTIENDIVKEILKQEAIKWIKRFYEYDNLEKGKWNCEGRKNKREKMGIDKFYDEETSSQMEIIDWIKHFFNITEEELK